MSKEVRYRGPSLLMMLQVLFIGLKLGNVIDWAWWQVMLPLICWVALMVVLFTILGIFTYLSER